MMNYEIFKEVVAEKFMEYMPEQYQGMRLRVEPVNKVNKVLDGITLVGSGAGRSVSPTLYINHMYEHYLETENLQEVLQSAARRMDMAFKEMPEVGDVNLEGAKDNIVFQVINTLQNEDMLRDMPHREFQDLSIIYRWVVKVDENGIQSSAIRNNLAEQLGMNEEQLFKCAVENTRRIFPPTVKSMNDVIREMFISDGMPAEVADMMIGEMPEDKMMWVISNDRGINGAGSMLYEDNLHKLAMKLETDLYILPSSVHECIAVSTNVGDPYELAEMVSEINMGQVALEDRLSNQVYHYDKDARRLTLATDTPNKRLDGMVAEAQLIYDNGKSR
ncbi:DUF5688 family protein [Oliverpabstia intestinalis]|uniref:DUF5688 family protein n=1 Tax=Oliverpabstia intestinalis TaxID=2606633 RepID=UPI003F897174